MSGRPVDALTLPVGTVTFLRTDVEGSMAFARTLGDRWDALNGTHLGLIRAAIDANGGVCVRTEGDAVFGAFPEAGAAVDAAVEAQRAIAGYDWPAGVDIRVRMGLHTGEAHLAGDDYGGFDVNRAARISAAGHGGQIVLSATTRTLIAGRLPAGVGLRDLGRHALRDVPDPEQLYQLDVPGLRTDFPPLRTAGPADGNLPLRMTSFIGRATDLDRVDRLLDAGRLVTLTGPGGIGKTSLATEVARERARRARDGAWFVALDTIDEPGQVASTIARTLGLFDGPERSAADALARFLATRSVLLVLDNFEHLLDAAGAVSALLRSSPETRILVTSRAPLHISGEQEYPVRSLGHDGHDDDDVAVRLFLERARAVRPGWDPGPDTSVVDEICDQLDGLPLGIELAAARISMLPPVVIRDRLAAHLPLPGTAPRDAPDRQRTLDATILWSYDLLPPGEQRLLRRLSVFEAGFDLDQVRLVDGPDADAGDDTLSALVALADRSLVTSDIQADRLTGLEAAVRFRLLRTIQAFGLARLRAEGVEPVIRRRHAEAYLELAEAAAPHLPSLEQSAWLDRLALDRAELRAAIRWAVGSGEVELALRLVGALWRFWQLGGYLDEGHDLIAAALAMPGAEPATPWRLRAITAAGGIAYWRAEREETLRLYQEQFDLAVTLDDDVAQADAAFNLLSAQFIADRQAAWASADDARLRFERLGDARGVARVDWGRATLLLGSGRAAEARPIFESTMLQFEALGDPTYHAMSMGSLAWIEFGNGDFAAARPWAIRSLVELYAVRDFASTTITLQEAVVLAVEAGRFEDAAILTGAFEGSCERIGVRPPIPLQRIIDTRQPSRRIAEAIDPETLAVLAERGRRMSLDEAVAYVLRMADAMGAATPDEAGPGGRPDGAQ